VLGFVDTKQGIFARDNVPPELVVFEENTIWLAFKSKFAPPQFAKAIEQSQSRDDPSAIGVRVIRM
jgi:hypothetical protein